MLRKDLGLTLGIKGQHLVGILAAGLHAGRAVGHARRRQTLDRGALEQKAFDVVSRHMPLDHVAIHARTRPTRAEC